MVETQLVARGISDPRILAAFRTVPRERFVPEHLRASAYDDAPLPIGSEQTISQPYIVAVMIDAAALNPADTVLEVGAGSGYAAAVIAQIASRVIAVERHEELARIADERLKRLGYGNISIQAGDGTRGVPGRQAFDAIIVSASANDVPDALLDHLKIGGRLVMPVGPRDGPQTLVKLTSRGNRDYRREEIGAVRFVPLIGANAWPEAE